MATVVERTQRLAESWTEAPGLASWVRRARASNPAMVKNTAAVQR